MPASILAEYQRREAAANLRLLHLRTRHRRWLAAFAAAAVFLLVCVLRILRAGTSAWPAVIGAVAALAILVTIFRVRRQTEWARRQALFYAACLERASGHKPQTGRTGEAYTPAPSSAGALFAADLEVLGAHSLFGMLATTRTAWGEQALASLLLEDAPSSTIRSRQIAVRELAPDIDLREAVALLGHFAPATLSPEIKTLSPNPLPAKSLSPQTLSPHTLSPEALSSAGLADWLTLSGPELPGWLRPALSSLTAAWLGVLLAGLLLGWPAGLLWRNLLVLWAAQTLLCWRVRPAALHELEAAKRLAGGLRLLREALSLLARQPFTAAHLLELQQNASARGEEASALRTLDRTLGLVEQRETGWIFALGLFVAAGTQEAFTLARWRARHANLLQRWVRAWAGFEALLVVATYAGEHDDLVYPDLVDPDPLDPEPPTRAHSHAPAPPFSAFFEAQGLKHPLLPADTAVGNTLRLGRIPRSGKAANREPATPAAAAQFLVVSGSNMAGKSTLLRAVGLCVVLARSGAPVPAQRLRLTSLRLGASLSLADSLAEGRSRFMAEVERLSHLVGLARAHPGEVLFLVDEILSGTNSTDRRIAAEAVVRALVSAGALGALSTHDLALTEIGDDPALGGRNTHMASATADDPLRFDFRLKPGPNHVTNGLAIVRLLGLLE